MSSEKKFNIDIRRSIILGDYIKHWGMPEYRVVSQKGSDVIEIYSFPPRDGDVVHRIASVGVSAIVERPNQKNWWELFMALPKGLGGETFERVASFLLDVAVYSLREDVTFCAGSVIPETPLMPILWPTKALLLDEPRCEPEELEVFHVASQHIDLLWVIPIYTEEYNFIKKRGLDAFEALQEKSEWSLADINRESVIQP